MKSIKFFAVLIGLAAIAGIVWPTFFMPPAPKEKPAVTVANAATAKGQEPWMVNERYNAPGRDIRAGRRWRGSTSRGRAFAPPMAAS